jgi:hypothetical protein
MALVKILYLREEQKKIQLRLYSNILETFSVVVVVVVVVGGGGGGGGGCRVEPDRS